MKLLDDSILSYVCAGTQTSSKTKLNGIAHRVSMPFPHALNAFNNVRMWTPQFCLTNSYLES